MINDGLWCAFEQCHMGNAGEVVAEHYHVEPRRRRTTMPRGAIRRRRSATEAGWFKDEILPVSIPQRKGHPIIVDRDEAIRPDTTAASLAALKPAFKKDGTVTAGNAPGVNDGASALVVMAAERARSLNLAPLARIVGQATSGLPPKFVLMTPVEAVRRVAQKVGWNAVGRRSVRAERGVFGAGGRGAERAWHSTEAKVNVNGGAVALGHAIGSSGARVLTTLLYALKQRNLKRGIATLCLGGGNGVALAVER